MRDWEGWTLLSWTGCWQTRQLKRPWWKPVLEGEACLREAGFILVALSGEGLGDSLWQNGSRQQYGWEQVTSLSCLFLMVGT